MKPSSPRRVWTGPVGLIVLAASAILSAQQPPVQKPPAPKPQATPQGPKYKSATDVVSTDVHVTDSAGRFIPDLTVKDFEVYEDGVLQTVANFAAVVGGRAMTDVAKTDEPAREGLIVPRSSKPVSVPGRIFIIFIDDLHIQPLDTPRTKALLKQIRDTVLHEDDLVGIVSSGYSSISFDLSPDAKHLRMNQAIDKTLAAGMTPYEIINTSQTMEGPSGLRANAHTAFKTAYDILEQAEKVTNRRKAFIYVSSGYDFNPFTESRYKAAQDLYATTMPARQIDQGRPGNNTDPLSSLSTAAGTGVYRNPFEMNGLQFSDADLAADLSELVRRARRASVAFYPIDPRGLDAGPDASQQVSLEEWHEFINTSVSSLQVMADQTGGKCGCLMNDFKKFLQGLDNEMSDYYVIGYESNNPDPFKVHRHIEIKVKRAGAKLIYTDTYSIKR